MTLSEHRGGSVYRPDIDGLRAVAVLAVVGFHAKIAAFSGGFAGVDIFFVISGYLIGGIIARDIAAGRFSLLKFYERRVRRIFPAMLAMLAVVSVLSTWLLLPGELLSYGKSLLAALFSVANFFLLNQSGYFDQNGAAQPLLHTWTLSVEEQFYLLFPVFLLLLRGVSERQRKRIIVGAALLSFLASVVTGMRFRDAAFYLAPLRAWEFLLGVMLCFGYLRPVRHPAVRHVASVIGLILILGAICWSGAARALPAFSALPPCLGAALLIAANETGPSLVGHVLSWRPIVFIGLISYSVYLWHWPLLLFQSTDLLVIPQRFYGHGLATPVLVALSLVLGYLSWRFIEQPFRYGSLRVPRKTLFLMTGTSAGVLSAAAIVLIALRGLPERLPVAARQVATYADFSTIGPWREEVCFITPRSSFAQFRPDICLAQHPGRRSVLLIGDSHAASLYPGLAAVFPDRDVLQANTSGCVAQLHEPRDQSNNCRQLFNFIFEEWLPNDHVDTVVLAGRWLRSDFSALGETVDWLHKHHINVIVVGTNLEFNAPLPRLLVTSMRRGTPESNIFPDSAKQQEETDVALAELSRSQWHVPYVSFFETFCQTTCPLYVAPQVPLTFDRQHLTLEASTLYARAIRERIQALEQSNSETPR